MYYVISVTGYEDYEPHWFSCSCSKKRFDKAVKIAINKAVEKMTTSKRKSYFIDGHCLLENTIPILRKMGFKQIKIDHEISVGGECIYTDREDRREIFNDSTWKKILKNNKKIHNRITKDLMKDAKEDKKEEKQ